MRRAEQGSRPELEHSSSRILLFRELISEKTGSKAWLNPGLLGHSVRKGTCISEPCRPSWLLLPVCHFLAV